MMKIRWLIWQSHQCNSVECCIVAGRGWGEDSPSPGFLVVIPLPIACPLAPLDNRESSCTKHHIPSQGAVTRPAVEGEGLAGSNDGLTETKTNADTISGWPYFHDSFCLIKYSPDILDLLIISITTMTVRLSKRMG